MLNIWVLASVPWTLSFRWLFLVFVCSGREVFFGFIWGHWRTLILLFDRFKFFNCSFFDFNISCIQVGRNQKLQSWILRTYRFILWFLSFLVFGCLNHNNWSVLIYSVLNFFEVWNSFFFVPGQLVCKLFHCVGPEVFVNLAVGVFVQLNGGWVLVSHCFFLGDYCWQNAWLLFTIK